MPEDCPNRRRYMDISDDPLGTVGRHRPSCQMAFLPKPPLKPIPAAEDELRASQGGMNRTSKLALETSALLEGTVTPRRLERWSHAGLVPPGHPSPPELAQWVGKAHLAELSATGPHGAEAMARRYGCACFRLGEVLRRKWLRNPKAPLFSPERGMTVRCLQGVMLPGCSDVEVQAKMSDGF